MNPILYKILGALTVAVTVATFGCAKVDGTSTPADESAAAQEPSIYDLQSYPEIDISKYDFSQEASSSGSTKALKRLEQNRVGSKSIAGCHARRLRDEAVARSKEIAQVWCYIKTMEESGLITLNPDGLDYYQLSMSREADSEGHGLDLLLQVGVVDDQFTMQACEGVTDEANFAVNLALEDSIFTGTLASHWTPEGDGDQEGGSTPSDFRGKLRITADGTPETFTTATFSGAFAATEDDGTNGFQGALDFEAVRADASNKVSGCFAENRSQSNFDVKMLSKFNDSLGTAKYAGRDNIPGRGGFSGVESFEFGTDGSGNQQTLIIDDDQSPYYDEVNAIVLDEAIADCRDKTNLDLAIADPWNCAAPAGNAFVAINLDGVDFSTCEAMTEDMEKNAQKEGEGCGEEESREGPANEGEPRDEARP